MDQRPATPPGSALLSAAAEPPAAPAGPPALKRALGPVMLWGLGVGYVISGEYMGWNLGLPVAGTFGLLIAFALITVLYVTFVFSYTELACAIPRAGGVFVYAVRGLGLPLGFVGGVAQAVEFIFAPPAIALGIGEYVNIWLPLLDKRWIAALAYLLFTAINVWGVKQAAVLELVVTVLAVGELLLFSAVVAPAFSWTQFAHHGWPQGWAGVLAGIPFAIWFYLAIEGVANAAEEARNPRRDISFGFGAAIATLVALATLVFFLGIGVGGWEAIVYDGSSIVRDPSGLVRSVAGGAATLDKPLPLALGQVVRPGHLLYRLLTGIGLLGLVASFHGIILAAGRALLSMGRAGFLPRFLGRVNGATRTPAHALLLNAALGIAAILFLDTGALLTLSALGAALLYVVAMLSLFALRRKEPELPRPFRAPLYPWFPLLALGIALVAFSVMAYYSLGPGGPLAWWFLATVLGASLYYLLFVRKRLKEEDLAHF